MRQPDRFRQSVRDQGSGRDDTVHQPPVDHLADDPPLLGHGHRAREREYDLAFRVAPHLQQNLERFPELPAGKGRGRHCAQEVCKRPDLRQVEAVQRDQAVAASVVKFAMIHSSRRCY